MKQSKRKQRVAYVLRRFPKISETFVLNEILAIEEQQLPVVIFAMLPTRDPRFHEDLAKLKATIYYLPDWQDFRLLWRHNVRAAKRNRREYFRTLFYVLKSLKPELLWRFLQSGYIADKAQQLRVTHLHAHFATRATSAALLTSKITNIPYSFTAHAVDIYKSTVRRRTLEKKIADANFVITVSECNKDYLRSMANGSADRVVRVYNGIDLERFKPNGDVPVDPFTILTVARLVEKKGLMDLIRACGLLAERNLTFQCWIVGKGRQRAQLGALIQELSLRDKVKLLGPHTQLEIAERYRLAHVLALPCKVAEDGNRDGLPVSIVEALGSGLPVVSTPVTGIPEVVQHGVNGLLVPERNPHALADALNSLISSESLYQELRAEARRSVLDNFNLQATGTELGQMFRNVAQ